MAEPGRSCVTSALHTPVCGKRSQTDSEQLDAAVVHAGKEAADEDDVGRAGVYSGRPVRRGFGARMRAGLLRLDSPFAEKLDRGLTWVTTRS